jgi:hypothetical protein
MPSDRNCNELVRERRKTYLVVFNTKKLSAVIQYSLDGSAVGIGEILPIQT